MNGQVESQRLRSARPSTPVLLSLRGLQHTYGATDVLAGVDVDVHAGEFVSVVGPSGCGKTTLLRVAAGLLAPCKGEVLWHGQPLRGPADGVSVVFQDYGRALFPWRTVRQNVELALMNAGLQAVDLKRRVGEVLALTGMAEHADKYPLQLSGGMQQRVQIARALAQKPKLILMDEPFGALDAFTRQALQDEVRRIVESAEVAILFITHDLEEAIYLGDRVVVLQANPGRVLATMEVDLESPRTQLTTKEDRRFLECRHALYTMLGARH